LTDQEVKSIKNLDYPPAATLKLATDELKAFYYESKSMQPGKHSFHSIQEWFWFDTTAGEVFLAIKEKTSHFEDTSFKGLSTTSLVPRVVQQKVAEQK
jgi:hypothetical protein